jgi:hypothetical protein
VAEGVSVVEHSLDVTRFCLHRGLVTRGRTVSLLCAALAAGCSESHGSRALDGSLEWLPPLICDRWERCEPSSPWGAEGCEAWVRADLENVALPRYEEAIARGHARVDPAARALCESYAAGACPWVSVAAQGGGGGLAGLASLMTSGCPHLIEGLLPVGAECAMDEECAGSAHCRLVSCEGGCRGVCEAPLPAGELCGRTFGPISDCEDGLACTFDGTESRCRRAAAIGEPCAAGLTPACALFARCEDGTCAAVDQSAPALGDTCGSDTAPCSGELVCAGTCAVPPDEGEACLALDSSFGLCGDGFVCEAEVCRAEPAEGDTCYPGVFRPFCPGVLRCSAGTCFRGRANGEACTEAGECISYRCEGGVCLAPPYYRAG